VHGRDGERRRKGGDESGVETGEHKRGVGTRDNRRWEEEE
jgi:hypothetical protein